MSELYHHANIVAELRKRSATKYEAYGLWPRMCIRVPLWSYADAGDFCGAPNPSQEGVSAAYEELAYVSLLTDTTKRKSVIIVR